MLSDWDDTGLEVEAAARIVASGGETLYADSDRGGTDTPAEGELGLGADEVPISRIRVLDSGGRINLNDNDNPVALSLATFFGASNTTSEWTLYIQLEDGTLITSDQLAATTGRAANFTIADSDDQAALNSIASGDSFIVAIARATPVAVDYTVDAGGVSWTFAIAQPTVTKVEPVAHAVDAGGVSWAFTIAEPTVTHTTLVSTDHAVNAGGVSWAFDVPEPTVTKVALVSTDYAVDAGGVSWAFDIAEPTVTHDRDTTAYAVDAGGVSWAFTIAEPTVTKSEPDAPLYVNNTDAALPWPTGEAIADITAREAAGDPAPTYAVHGSLPDGIAFDTTSRVISGTPTAEGSGLGSGSIVIRATNVHGFADWTLRYYIAGRPVAVKLEIDWGNDGLFTHAAADVTGDLIKKSLTATRGRTLQSRRRANSGRIEFRLWNLAHKYDPLNAESPIFERDISGLRVRLSFDGEEQWGGVLDDTRYVIRPVPYVKFIGLGLLSTLKQPVSVASQSNTTVGAVARLVVAAAGRPTTHIEGGKSLDMWKGAQEEDALLILHDLEETEEGYLYERADAELALEDENARSTGVNAVSAAVFSDNLSGENDIALLKGSYRDWGFKQIANVVRVPVETLVVSATIVLWTLPQDVVLAAGQTVSIIIQYPTASSPSSHRGVGGWLAPEVGTDYTAQTGLTITGSVSGDRYLVQLENSSGGSLTVNMLQVRGVALVVGDPVYIEAKDTVSISAFGEREYDRPAKLFTELAAAQEYADGIVARQRSPHGWLVARWAAHHAPSKAASLDISRRVTVERDGERSDYYIEGIRPRLRGGRYTIMEYLLSPVPGATVPGAPLATAVRVTSTSATVTWSEPYNGGLAITDYDIRFKRVLDNLWTDKVHVGTGRASSLTGLEDSQSYEVQVLARNSLGPGAWSQSAVFSLGVVPSTPAMPTVTFAGSGALTGNVGCPL